MEALCVQEHTFLNQFSKCTVHEDRRLFPQFQNQLQADNSTRSTGAHNTSERTPGDFCTLGTFPRDLQKKAHSILRNSFGTITRRASSDEINKKAYRLKRNSDRMTRKSARLPTEFRRSSVGETRKAARTPREQKRKAQEFCQMLRAFRTTNPEASELRKIVNKISAKSDPIRGFCSVKKGEPPFRTF